MNDWLIKLIDWLNEWLIDWLNKRTKKTKKSLTNNKPIQAHYFQFIPTLLNLFPSYSINKSIQAFYFQVISILTYPRMLMQIYSYINKLIQAYDSKFIPILMKL